LRIGVLGGNGDSHVLLRGEVLPEIGSKKLEEYKAAARLKGILMELNIFRFD